MQQPIPAHSTLDTNTRPDSGSKASSSGSWSQPKVLIEVTLGEFDVNLDTLLSGLSGPSPALKWTYSGSVSPQ